MRLTDIKAELVEFDMERMGLTEAIEELREFKHLLIDQRAVEEILADYLIVFGIEYKQNELDKEE